VIIQGLHQLREPALEGRGNPKEIFCRNIAAPAFHLADIGVIQASCGSELLLRQVETLPMTANRGTQQLQRGHQEVA